MIFNNNRRAIICNNRLIQNAILKTNNNEIYFIKHRPLLPNTDITMGGSYEQEGNYIICNLNGNSWINEIHDNIIVNYMNLILTNVNTQWTSNKPQLFRLRLGEYGEPNYIDISGEYSGDTSRRLTINTFEWYDNDKVIHHWIFEGSTFDCTDKIAYISLLLKYNTESNNYDLIVNIQSAGSLTIPNINPLNLIKGWVGVGCYEGSANPYFQCNGIIIDKD